MTSGATTLSLLHLLHAASQQADDAFVASLGDHTTLTPRQAIVLEAAANLTEPSQTDLVHAVGIDRSTIADIMSRLLRKGLIQRQRAGRDARRYIVSLTAKGEAARERGRKAVEAADRVIAQRVPADLRKALRDGLHAIAHGETTTKPPIQRAAPLRQRETRRKSR